MGRFFTFYCDSRELNSELRSETVLNRIGPEFVFASPPTFFTRLQFIFLSLKKVSKKFYTIIKLQHPKILLIIRIQVCGVCQFRPNLSMVIFI